METIVTQIAEKFIKNIIKSMTAIKKFTEIEEKTVELISNCAAEIVGAYMEYVDGAIEGEKAVRRKSGYHIERRGDKRTLITQFGEVKYRRTYYKKAAGGYEYLADTVMGIESRMRVSEGLSLSLAAGATEMSYAKASRYIAKELVSRQTVMKCVRQSEAGTSDSKVQELHVDADEAHITLHGGMKSIVPLISVYEGIACEGKRNYCKNIFHISEYGKTPDELWEQTLSEIEKRYDLTGTKIYFHGDGGSWIQSGLEWLPNAVFVLDKYHKNKAIKAMTAGLDKKSRNDFDTEIRKSLNDEDMDFFDQLTGSLCMQIPERREKIVNNANYLKRFVSGISICRKDLGANNGGCTEPHISHVLASRLSSRPMTWSKKTLQKLAPILASGKVEAATKSDKTKKSECLPKPLYKAAASASKALCKGLGRPEASSIGRLPLSGKTNGTQKLLKLFV